MWFIQISQLQGDLVIMFSDGLRDNLHDREAVHVFFWELPEPHLEKEKPWKPTDQCGKAWQIHGPIWNEWALTL